MSARRPPPTTSDVENALRDASLAVRAGHPEEPITISAAALWLLNEMIHAQSERIKRLRNRQPSKATK
jgi:hypothetical protein